ncbi:recombination protein RecT [Caminicella sporogenes DSM 14501]|uniref:Recombination protein RecT n=1 Tax=Caminicella sporogenes DSM 14501 TaxID=1121266 RepID=A0A1M6MZ92_9FIRM|nr:recombinase RecT [Caminicella sporogenes]RKD22429.1 recombinase RecT [Caminicella sporogenes]WIF95158.1 recombinase RecT [Caminicella sporogenes]SHJ88807.1 recombination protein RecT [Caminicella sporogenes DSM 14501]
MASSKVKNALVNRANKEVSSNKPKTIKDWIKVMEPEIKKALPSVITPERFTRMALTAISVNPKLAECTPKSFMGALMNAAQLGLEPNTPLGQAYLIPFKNKGIMEVQFQLGYKGLIDLAYRSGEFANIYAKEVYENDVFEYEFGLEPNLVHKPATKDRGEVIAYYAVFKLVNGGFGFEVMSKEDIIAHAKKYSQSYNSKYSPWTNNFDEMAKKTVLKKVLKYAPIKVEFVRQVTEDGTIKSNIAENMSEVPNENVFEAEYTVEDADDVNEASEQLEGQQTIDDLKGTPFQQ